MTGVLVDVVAHVSGVVWPSSAREVLAVPGQAPHGPRHAPGAAAPAAPPPWSAPAHGRRSLFQLHSRPPRQRPPSSLVIESAAASPAEPHLITSGRGTSDER